MATRFGTVLNCIDGRTQVVANTWMKEKYSLDFVDTITEPGIDLVLAQGRADEIQRIREKLEISIRAHGSNAVAIVGHFDCAANPVGKEEHFGHILLAIETIESWDLPVEISGLWIDENWHVHPVGV